jgi:hypothetical protein
LGDDVDVVKKMYRNFIFPYEKRTYFGLESVDEEANMVLGEPRKMIKT